MTVKDVAPRVLLAVTLLIIASSVISGLAWISIITWLERLLLNEGGLGYLWTKKANIPAACGWLHHLWPYLFMALWLLALMSKDLQSRTQVFQPTEIFMILYLKSCNVTCLRSFPPLFLTQPWLLIEGHSKSLKQRASAIFSKHVSQICS